MGVTHEKSWYDQSKKHKSRFKIEINHYNQSLQMEIIDELYSTHKNTMEEKGKGQKKGKKKLFQNY